MRSTRSNVHSSMSSAARSDAQIRMTTAMTGRHLMKHSARVVTAAIVILLASFVTSGQVKDFKPVTDAMLLNPDPADWPNWRRTLDGWGYSPLKQINAQNVHQLQLAWSWGLVPGISQPTPLVANGMMFVPVPGGGVQTLDAQNGDLLWDFRARPVGDG